MQVWTSCTRLAENTGRKKVAKNRHLGTIAQLCRAISLQLRHISTIGKKLVKQQYVLQMPHNMVNVGLLAAEIGWPVWGTPANFNWFRIFAALLHGILVVGVSQTLRRWTEGATYIRQGDHHVGHWPTFLVVVVFAKLHAFSTAHWIVRKQTRETSLSCCLYRFVTSIVLQDAIIWSVCLLYSTCWQNEQPAVVLNINTIPKVTLTNSRFTQLAKTL